MNTVLILGIFIVSNTIAAPLKDKVSFTPPITWEKMSNMPDIISDTVCAYTFFIESKNINNEKHNANALLQYYKVPKNTDISFANRIVASRLGAANYILSAMDKPYWQTFLFSGNDRNEQYIILYRIGIFKGICVEFMLSFPHDRTNEHKNDNLKVLSLEPKYVVDDKISGIYCSVPDLVIFIDDFNSFCNNLKIMNKNIFHAKAVFLDQPEKSNSFRDTTLTE